MKSVIVLTNGCCGILTTACRVYGVGLPPHSYCGDFGDTRTNHVLQTQRPSLKGVIPMTGNQLFSLW
jgi:hypothetical protein